MSGDKAGWFFILVGLILAVFADPIGRLKAKGLPGAVKPFQAITFFGGLCVVIVGILKLLGVL